MWKSKSSVFIVTIIILVILSAIACSAPAPQPATPATTQPTAAQKPEPFVMKVATDTPATQPLGVALNWFADEIKKQIPGAEVRTFHAGTLYATADGLEAMRSGTLESCWATSGKATGVLSELSVLGIPMTITTEKQFMGLNEGKWGAYLNTIAKDKGFTYLGWGTVSPLIGIAGKTRILTPDDYKGKKVRSFDKVAHPAMMQKVGASAVNLAWADFPTSIQSGVVDAGIAGLVSWGGVREAAPYLSLPGYGGFGVNYYYFLVSKTWFDKLNPATQAVIRKVAADACAMEVKLQATADSDSMTKYGTQDPSKPGAYLLPQSQADVYSSLWVEPVSAEVIKSIGAKGKEANDTYMDAIKALK